MSDRRVLGLLLFLLTALVLPAGADGRWSYGTWIDTVSFSKAACGALATDTGSPNSYDRFLRNVAVIAPQVGQVVYDTHHPGQADAVVTKVSTYTDPEIAADVQVRAVEPGCKDPTWDASAALKVRYRTLRIKSCGDWEAGRAFGQVGVNGPVSCGKAKSVARYYSRHGSRHRIYRFRCRQVNFEHDQATIDCWRKARLIEFTLARE
jgi:hypothetical protein